MAVKLRLKRIGRRKRPFYRIVAIDSRTRRDGSEIERLGWYDPLRTDVAIKLHEERIIYWLNEGAQPSETVNNILKEMGLKYKIHLIKEGKSEEQIVSLLIEWQLRQEENRAQKLEKKADKNKADAKAKEAEIAEAASTAAKVEEKTPEPAKEAPVEEVVAQEPQDVAVEEAPVKEEPEAETAAEEAPVEESVAEEPKEEAVEEAPVKEEPEAETAAEEAPVEKIIDESEEPEVQGYVENAEGKTKKKNTEDSDDASEEEGS